MVKDLAYYMALHYPILLTELSVADGGGWFAEIPLLKGCWSDGETQIEALTNIEEAKEVWLAGAIEENLPIPEPESIPA